MCFEFRFQYALRIIVYNVDNYTLNLVLYLFLCLEAILYIFFFKRKSDNMHNLLQNSLANDSLYSGVRFYHRKQQGSSYHTSPQGCTIVYSIWLVNHLWSSNNYQKKLYICFCSDFNNKLCNLLIIGAFCCTRILFNYSTFVIYVIYLIIYI